MTLPFEVTQLFKPLVPFRSGRLAVDARHELYWEECGNPAGTPVLFLHGGPGGGISPQHRRFFDPAFYRIVLFDQRGAGQSTPLGEYRDNTTPLLVADIEQLRAMLGIAQWLVFGGSWGSTLALAYGQAHPQACLGFILRGIFLGSQTEIDWFIDGIKGFYPEAHQRFAEFIPADERDDLIHACFLAQNQLLDGIDAIRHLPAVIVQGRYDVVCPPVSAHRLHAAWPQAQLRMIADAGHAALEPGTASALVAATEAFRLRGHFN